MYNKLNIPSKLVVGFQHRNDTYSGKLAYVVYYKNKAETKIVKEKSWTGWCSPKIPTEYFDNEPIEGFVVNRNAGGVGSGWGWNDRMEKVRVFDPRGFEIEITIPNLLYILQECTSTKGKGLEGKFVYSWSGAELILLPVDSEEYRKSTDYNELQKTKVNAKDIVAGMSFTDKNENEVIYMGKFDWITRNQIKRPSFMARNRNGYYYYYWDIPYMEYSKKMHIFASEFNGEVTFFAESGFTKLAFVNSETPVENYPELLDKLAKDKHYVEPKGIEATNTNEYMTASSNYYRNFDKPVALKNEDGSYTTYAIERVFDMLNYRSYFHKTPKIVGYKIHPVQEVSWVKDSLKVQTTTKVTDEKVLTKSEVEALPFEKIYLSLGDGSKRAIMSYGYRSNY